MPGYKDAFSHASVTARCDVDTLPFGSIGSYARADPPVGTFPALRARRYLQIENCSDVFVSVFGYVYRGPGAAVRVFDSSAALCESESVRLEILLLH